MKAKVRAVDVNSKVRALQQKIEHIKRRLVAVGDLRPGTLSEQYNVCGSAGCQCKDDPPRKHGPYHQLSWTRKRKSRTRFVRSEHVAAVRRQLANYARLQSLLDQWIEVSIELHDLTLKAKKNK